MTLATISVWGCNQDLDESPEIDAAESSLTRPNWVPCASQGQHCAFNGRRNVRYGFQGRFVTHYFSGGVHCDGSQFGTRSYSSASCAFDARNQPAANGGAAGGPAAAAGGPAAAAGSAASGHDGHVMAGSGAPVMGAAGSAPVMGAAGSDPHMGHTSPGDAAGSGGMGGSMAPSGAAGSTPSDPHSGHAMGGSGGAAGGAPAMMGPYIDMSAIPTGDRGSSTVDISSTSEKPAAGDGTGMFRTSCDFSHMAKNDPLVFPGQPGASHLHAFFGNTGTDANSTQDSIRNSGNSTCRGGIANRSSYWVPALIDAQGKPVKPISMDVYYKSGYNGIAASAIKPFPSGLRVIAGSAKASSAQEHAFWECHGAYNGHPGSIPQCPGAEAIKMMVEFPQCWDGKNLDSADHMSHMAYPSGGKCPSTHPVPIPAITFNVLYPVRDSSGWHLASDMYDQKMPGGFSAHADWFEGWDPKVSEAFVKNCVNPAVDCHSHLLGDGRAIN
ncbi:MAG TPA: DUF1996 domain-containing protein [Polyangiales bacterium]|nr:DUF1996 domain-containing protein [Polyangiales bacterium]